ncbi:MAG: hypothetical protein O2968_03320 [Acidobacteria bacterium]|nr:hypothetical protein [Acidobacteriota bacterium]
MKDRFEQSIPAAVNAEFWRNWRADNQADIPVTAHEPDTQR